MIGERRSRDPLRRAQRAVLVRGLIASAGVHAALAAVLALTHAALPSGGTASTRPIAVELLPALADPPPAVEMPRARPPVPRPAAPETPALAPLATDEPRFIPHDVPPRLLNGVEIRDALEAGLFGGLPEEAADRRVMLWLFVDESGAVRKLRLQGSSGFDELDALASRVAHLMAYRPALHRGRRVAVWVSQPIRFRHEAGDAAPPAGGGDGSDGSPRGAQPAGSSGTATPISGWATGFSQR